MRVHFTHSYLLNPQHTITVNLIGVGGTGSQVLTALARVNEALIGLDHPGLHVRAYDPDEVSTANIGRQMFSPADLGMNKAICLITRVNRFFGYEWEAEPREYTSTSDHANITITCVDSAAARISIGKCLNRKNKNVEPTDIPLYWLDFGNSQKTGQVVLGTTGKLKQPEESEYTTVGLVPTVVKLFPNLRRVKEENQGPSCSLAEALTKQDLFINSTLAQLGTNLLWKLFREGMITHHGCYLNLETMSVNPIKV